MSSITADAVREEISQNALKEGNPVKKSTGLPSTVSGVLYTDSSSVLQSGALPFELPVAGIASTQELKVSGVSSTAVGFLDFTSVSTLSADELMHTPLVAGAAVTTFTSTGFIRVKITDSAGNLTDGYHYIQLGTLS